MHGSARARARGSIFILWGLGVIAIGFFVLGGADGFFFACVLEEGEDEDFTDGWVKRARCLEMMRGRASEVPGVGRRFLDWGGSFGAGVKRIDNAIVGQNLMNAAYDE